MVLSPHGHTLQNIGVATGRNITPLSVQHRLSETYILTNPDFDTQNAWVHEVGEGGSAVAPRGNGNQDDLAAKFDGEGNIKGKKKRHLRSFEARVKRLDNRKENKRNARRNARANKAMKKLNDQPGDDHWSYLASQEAATHDQFFWNWFKYDPGRWQEVLRDDDGAGIKRFPWS